MLCQRALDAAISQDASDKGSRSPCALVVQLVGNQRILAIGEWSAEPLAGIHQALDNWAKKRTVTRRRLNRECIR